MHSSCHLYFHNTLEDFILFLSLSMFSNYSLMAKHDLVLGTQRGISHSLSSLKVYTWLHMFRGFWFIDPFETPIFCEKKTSFHVYGILLMTLGGPWLIPTAKPSLAVLEASGFSALQRTVELCSSILSEKNKVYKS